MSWGLKYIDFAEYCYYVSPDGLGINRLGSLFSSSVFPVISFLIGAREGSCFLHLLYYYQTTQQQCGMLFSYVLAFQAQCAPCPGFLGLVNLGHSLGGCQDSSGGFAHALAIYVRFWLPQCMQTAHLGGHRLNRCVQVRSESVSDLSARHSVAEHARNGSSVPRRNPAACDETQFRVLL